MSDEGIELVKCHMDCGSNAAVKGPYGEAFCVPCAIKEAKRIRLQARLDRLPKMAIPKLRRKRKRRRS